MYQHRTCWTHCAVACTIVDGLDLARLEAQAYAIHLYTVIGIVQMSQRGATTMHSTKCGKLPGADSEIVRVYTVGSMVVRRAHTSPAKCTPLCSRCETSTVS